MPLVSGTRLGPYEILSPLGAGGMGEVWKARDTRLGRTVAIKVLSDRLARNEEVRQRFEREAETISQLSHPHICALYDVGNQDGVEYLVMEYLEGQTLADRMAKGALPLDQALKHAGQIADALDCAHRRGIVHRDLKPGNVMLTRSGVKLLDFGLAKALAPSAPAESLTAAPTVAKDLTREGTILGTVAYMAPEQLEGREADERTDLFALGAVLYEMTTGRKAFAGATHASLASAIMKDEPAPLSSLQPAAAPSLDRLVRTCLAKDPERRWRSAHDVSLQLAAIVEGSDDVVAPAAAPTRLWKWAAAAGAIAFCLALLLRPPAPAAPPAPAIRFPLLPPPGGRFSQSVENCTLALSPDGTRVAFVVVEPRRATRLWQRTLSELDARPIEGTDGARSLFWSPDGRSIGFFAEGKLKRLALSGGAPVTICDVGEGIGRSGSWSAGGHIVFASVQGDAIYRVPADGGRAEVAVRYDAAPGEIGVVWPWYLPDGEKFFYLAMRQDGEHKLMLSEPGRPPRGILALRSIAQYVDPGYLVYSREGVLLAQRFDPEKGRMTGAPLSIAPQVSYFLSSGWAGFATARSGTIVYFSHHDVDRLAWFDRSGRPLGEVGAPGNYLDLAISPDGRRALSSRARPETGTYDIWMFDLERGVEAAVTSDPESEFSGRWLPDGKAILYSAGRRTVPRIFRRELATGREVPLLPLRGFQEVLAVSPDGRNFAFAERLAGGAFELFTMPVSGNGPPEKFAQPALKSERLRFSPDGTAVAFIAEESGRKGAFVAPFGAFGERIRVSPEGAGLLCWSRDGKELVYLSADDRVVAVPVRTTPSLEVGRPSTLFHLPEGKGWKDFDLAPDGRILAIVKEVSGAAQPATVAVNWTAELKKP